MTATTLNPVLEIRRVFDASPEAVFDAWFEREQWQAWLGPENGRCDVPVLEPMVGGRYHLTMHLADGREMPVQGVFRIIDRPRCLAFTWLWQKLDMGETLMRLDFRAVPGGTELTLTHEGLRTEQDRTEHAKGWNSTLNKLARFIEGD